MFASGTNWLRFWVLHESIDSCWEDWVQLQNGILSDSGIWPLPWPGPHPILCAHTAEMAGCTKKAKLNIRTISVIYEVLFVISI